MPDKIISYISSLTPIRLIFFVTFFVLSGSIPIVYLSACIAGVEYTSFLLEISIGLPLILTPVTIYILISLTTKLQYFQKHLAKEIEKNKLKDIMLFEQARFVLMGEMLANISHQWKQPLNTINLAILNLKLSESDSDSRDKYFDIIEDNVNHLASTINDFMSFFDKRSHSEIKEISSIVQEIESIVTIHATNSKINLKLVVDDNCAGINLASSISQVVINLINNAKDALEGKQSKEILVHFKASSSGVKIECCDNGSGIPKAIREKIFDPYFTTKEKRQGTGIGLYMSKQIISKIFDGTITIIDKESLEHKTCFLIKLPYSEKCILKEKE